MNIFSLSYLVELAAQLPNPEEAARTEAGYAAVIRLPLREWDSVVDADHPEREFEAHKNPFVEFEIILWKDTKGATAPRWVLRGLVAV